MSGPSDEKMESEGCTKGSLASVVPGEQLTTYRWSGIPSGTAPRAVVLLLHGFRSHACYTYLRNEDGVQKYGSADGSSFARELNLRGFVAAAHDHVGHGRSSGLRAFFPSFDALVGDAVAHARALQDEFPGVPLFVVGHSMGGTVAITAASRHADLFRGMCLSSAACEPPEDMFGLKGTIMASMSAIIAAVAPRMQVLELPKNTRDPVYQKTFENDPLNCAGVNLRARVGREFILAYDNIAKTRGQVKTPFFAAAGEHDTMVNPSAAKRFTDGAGSEDKTLFIATGRWHNLFQEANAEEIWKLFGDWISERCNN